MARGVITISFSQDKFDQWRLSEAGGRIVLDQRGRPVFQFTSREQFDKYLRLNARRDQFEKERVSI